VNQLIEWQRLKVSLEENKLSMLIRTGIKEDGKPYAVESDNGKPFVTRKYVTASVGAAKRDWPFIFCSRERFSEVSYFHQWFTMKLTRLARIYSIQGYGHERRLQITNQEVCAL
jgi:hypothetical protein